MLGRRRTPRAFTLLEVVVVVALLGIMAAMALSRYGSSTLGNVGAQADARRIALDLLQARRRAISSGDNHFVQFSPGGSPTSYTLYQSTGGSDVAVESARSISQDVTVTPSHTDCEFTFEGTALASYSITVAGPDRTWTISVVATTGSITVAETP